MDVIEKLGRPVSSSGLGRYRRRWLERPPRDPSSGHRNRLEATLASMIEDGVLVRQLSGRGGSVYSPGPQWEEWKEKVAA